MTFKSTISETNNLIIKPHLLFKAAFIAALFFISACGTNQITYYSFNGQTMGTFYNITFEGKETTPALFVDSAIIDDVAGFTINATVINP